jgi:toxin ParE1/3/4
MANARYYLTEQTVGDLQSIAHYIGQRNVEAADRVLDVLYETFSFLAQNTHVGTSRDELLPGIRVFSPPQPAHNYLIAYFTIPDRVEIAAVLHGARDWPGLLVSGDR